jgi:hypothetical protein
VSFHGLLLADSPPSSQVRGTRAAEIAKDLRPTVGCRLLLHENRGLLPICSGAPGRCSSANENAPVRRPGRFHLSLLPRLHAPDRLTVGQEV